MTEFLCECGSVAFESDMVPGTGVVRTCLSCGARSMGARHVSEPVGTLETGGVTRRDLQPQLPGFEAPRLQLKPAKRQSKAFADVPLDVIKLAKRRLRYVKSEIRRLRKLEAERDQLERMLNAADARPVAAVRELKRSG